MKAWQAFHSRYVISYHSWNEMFRTLSFQLWYKMTYFRRQSPVCVKVKTWHAQEDLKHWHIVLLNFHLTLTNNRWVWWGWQFNGDDDWWGIWYSLFSLRSVLGQKLVLSRSQLLDSQEPDDEDIWHCDEHDLFSYGGERDRRKMKKMRRRVISLYLCFRMYGSLLNDFNIT